VIGIANLQLAKLLRLTPHTQITFSSQQKKTAEGITAFFFQKIAHNYSRVQS
jgi:hypothetical protein